ncbi:MAG: hypothetical protein JNM21_01615 [Taibaiella sp.]|nr:hypothetical protein [Taibaiella sp.]
MPLPSDIKQVFINTLNEDMSVPEFEQWLYAEKRLESLLDKYDYLDLIAYPYKSDTQNGLFKLLEKHIDKGEQEMMRMDQLLTKALDRDKSLPGILSSFYNMYCKGYYFLEELGLNYGLRINVPEVNSNYDTWQSLTTDEQNTLLASFYPELETELIKVISWLDNGKIILTGIRNEYDRLDFIDNREITEK